MVSRLHLQRTLQWAQLWVWRVTGLLTLCPPVRGCPSALAQPEALLWSPQPSAFTAAWTSLATLGTASCPRFPS